MPWCRTRPQGLSPCAWCITRPQGPPSSLEDHCPVLLEVIACQPSSPVRLAVDVDVFVAPLRRKYFCIIRYAKCVWDTIKDIHFPCSLFQRTVIYLCLVVNSCDEVIARSRGVCVCVWGRSHTPPPCVCVCAWEAHTAPVTLPKVELHSRASGTCHRKY